MKLVRTLIVTLALGLCLFALSQPTSGGTMVFAGNQEPSSIDPLLMSGNVNEREVAAQMFETLVYMDQDQVVHPGLAVSWSSSDDKTEWTFDVRQGVSFHNGDPFSAQSVVAQLEFVRNDESLIGGAWGVLKPLLVSAEAVDEDTVVVTLKEPRPDLLTDLADPGLGITNIAHIERVGQDASFQPIGTGPFKFKEWISGSHITLERNPDWTWGSTVFDHSGPAYLDELVFRFIPEAQTRLATLETGETHFLDLLPFADIQRLYQDSRFTVTEFLLPGMPQMNYLNTRISPTNDLAVRQAINYATDKQAIIDTVYFGLVEPAYGPLSRAFPEYDPSLENMYPYDPDMAIQLLEEAGWVDSNGDGVREKDGEALSVVIVENKSWNDWVYVLQALLQDIGFDAEVLTTQGPSNTAAIASGQYAVPSMGDVFANVTQMTRDWHSDGYGTFPSSHFWDDPTLDELLEDAQTEIDIDVRTEKYVNIQNYIMENALMVPIFELFFYAAHANNLDGFVVDATGFYKYFAAAHFN
ncbi:MAG: ABC transporter substrate-binding protein [Trueperaceae bacterium]|nr:MAG: ABC transporter substrate-binding protein [Trueperaceae bacterium]